MRLLYTTSNGKLEFTEDIIRSEDIPPYAILSHTWGEQEVVFDDVKSLDSGKDIEARTKDGWRKIEFCAQQAKRDGFEHFWVDTCCINKANSTELSEAINSMFRWYQNADKCYVFLADVEGKFSEENGKTSSRWKTAFRASRWFSRGWTLQELLAPCSVKFFSNDGALLGDKESLKQTIHEITNIPIEALSGSDLSEFDVAERFSWAQNRRTTREEDGAYCLLGIFGCHLPLIYGEGRERALKRLRKEMLEASEDIVGPLVNNAESRSRSQQERLGEIRSWLSAPDPSTNYYKARKQRQADTGLWLLESAKFEEWKESTASWLWLYGIPGCGKTILSSTIIEHLQQHTDDGTRRVTVYFYFDFKDVQKQDPELMLRSLLSQLLQHAGMIPQDLEALFSANSDGQQPPLLHALLEIVPQLMRQFTHVYIVLDALDECTQRPELMDMLETVAGWRLEIVHLLMTSRKERDIEMSLKSYIGKDDTVCLQRDVVDEDISRYVRQRLQDDNGLVKWNKNADIRQEIETALTQGAHGMFRWAVCQLDTLARCRNLAMLRKSLATLPRTLDQTYDRILTAISPEDCSYAIRILQWLTFSTRPLSVEEVAEVVAIDVTREPAFDRNEVLIDPLEALDICSSLVTITTSTTHHSWKPEEQIIALAHYSVQEYLVSDRIKQGPAKQYSMQEVECHKAITAGSLGYLNQFQQPITREISEVPALAWYSAQFWNIHIQKTRDEAEEVSLLATNLLSKENPAYLNWVRLCDPEDPRRRPNFGAQLQTIGTPLYYGALLGLSTVTKFLLDQGADVNAQNGNYDSALYAASAYGHEAVVKLLIDANADVNVPGGDFGNALQAASVGGHNAVVTMLIDADAEVNAHGGFYGSALEAASAYGHEAVVKLLIDAGAHINAPGRFFRNALHAAFASKKETTVKTLLEKGANIVLDVHLKGTSHHAADSDWCPPSVVSTLHQYGRPLDMVDANNMTFLHYCVKRGHKAVAKQLINAGVSIDVGVRRRVWPSEPYEANLDKEDTMPIFSRPITTGLTALHFAALIGDVTMTEFLLKHGANPNARSEYGETPLHLALRVTLLGGIEYKDDWHNLSLEAGDSWSTTQRTGYGIRTYYFQSPSQREQVLDTLLADPRSATTATDDEGNSLLHCIRYGESNSSTLVRRLVSKRVDPLSGNLKQQTPLHFASKAGDHVSVKALLNVGAKVTATDELGLNALHHAAQSGNFQTIMSILETEEAKAVKLVASKDKREQNVLHHVLFTPCEEQMKTVQWLLGQGADGAGLDESGDSPLASLIKFSEGEMEIELFALLLAIKGNESFVDHSGQTLGHLCATRSNFGVPILELLKEYSVDLAKKDSDGKTVLHRAAICGNLDSKTLEFLVKVVGIHASEEDTRGRTALQYAIEEAAKDRSPVPWKSKYWEWTRDVLLEHHAKHNN